MYYTPAWTVKPLRVWGNARNVESWSDHQVVGDKIGLFTKYQSDKLTDWNMFLEVVSIVSCIIELALN